MSNDQPGPATLARHRWEDWIAKTTAVLAVLAALSSGQWGASNLRAILEQGKVDDGWSYYQAKSIKASVLDAKIVLANSPNESDAAKRDRYEKEQEEIKSEAEHKQVEAKSNFHLHEIFARSVTMFQIAIAIAAISALMRKRRFWIVSLLFGIAGCIFLALGFIH